LKWAETHWTILVLILQWFGYFQTCSCSISCLQLSFSVWVKTCLLNYPHHHNNEHNLGFFLIIVLVNVVSSTDASVYHFLWKGEMHTYIPLLSAVRQIWYWCITLWLTYGSIPKFFSVCTIVTFRVQSTTFQRGSYVFRWIREFSYYDTCSKCSKEV